MIAGILSIGDELTLGQALDTNSAWLSARLASESIVTVEHRTVADDCAAIAEAICVLANNCDVLLTTGGLGPTADDLTREALVDVLTPGAEAVVDEAAIAHLEGWFTKRGRRMPEMNRKQALRPSTMQIMPNPNGTAPGLIGRYKECMIASMPGPPREMQPMFENHVRPVLLERMSRSAGEARVIRTAMVQEYGMGESIAAEKLGSLMDRTNNPLVGTTASDSIVSARIRAEGNRTWVDSEVDRIVAIIERTWQPYAFGGEGSSLAQSVGELLKSRKQTLTTAESCTGGWLGKMIVDRAGSSEYYLGGWVTYSNGLKSSCLNVPSELIKEHGAVSEHVACAMAAGAARASGADWALSITGVAGPDGGKQLKPMGTVWIGLAGRGNSENPVNTTARTFCFPGDRTTIRDRACKSALQMLRFALLGVEQTPLLWEVEAAPTERASSNLPVREVRVRS